MKMFYHLKNIILFQNVIKIINTKERIVKNMITSISMWAKQLAISVILSTLILMILPENKNKKYIKVIAGIFILFCTLNPITSKAIDINEYNLDNYISQNNNSQSAETYTDRINKEFESKMIESIDEELKKIGYKSNKISVSFDNNYNLQEIKILNVEKYYQINKIEVKKDDSGRKISNSEKDKIQEEISKKYSIEK